MRVLGNDDKQVVIAPCPSSSLVSLGGGNHVETTKKNYPWLVFGCEGGGGGGSRVEMNYPQLAFGCEGGGGGGSHVEMMKKNYPWLAFGCEGGGGGGSHVETMKMTTSGSCLDAREVVVMGVT